MPYRLGFVIEQTLGHVSHQRNLYRWAECDPTVQASWLPIPGWADDFWAKVPVLRGNMTMSLSLRTWDRLRRGVGELDAILFHTQSTAMFSSSLTHRLPVVVSLDATPLNMDTVAAGYRHRPDTKGPLSRLKLDWYRRVFLRAAALTTHSEWARDSLVHEYRIPAHKIEVIPPGVDLQGWRPAAKPDDPRRLPRVLFVGGDFDRKGGPDLLASYREALAGRCCLEIVTGSEEVEAGEGVRIHRGLGPESADLSRLFAEADLFVLPTLADCTPHSINEAMASGLPVVATDVGAISEQVADGETGLLVPAGDRKALIDAVGGLLDDPGRRATMGRAGRARAERLFDGERNYQALAGLLKRCVEERRATGRRQLVD